jgi:hypothetical protein
MARQGAGLRPHRATAGGAAQSHDPPAYHRVRWMLAATHALIRYGAVGISLRWGPVRENR